VTVHVLCTLIVYCNWLRLSTGLIKAYLLTYLTHIKQVAVPVVPFFNGFNLHFSVAHANTKVNCEIVYLVSCLIFIQFLPHLYQDRPCDISLRSPRDRFRLRSCPVDRSFQLFAVVYKSIISRNVFFSSSVYSLCTNNELSSSGDDAPRSLAYRENEISICSTESRCINRYVARHGKAAFIYSAIWI